MKFSFKISDKVMIPELNRPGYVKSIWITETGVKYEVRYFDNASVKEVYFYPEEIEHAK